MWILDASIAVKWFFSDEEGHEKAREVLNRLVEHPEQFSVPSLFFFELAAVLTRKSKFEKKFIQESLEAVFQLGVPAMEVGEELLEGAISISCLYQVSYYDALYIALARILKGVWLTADVKAVKKLPSGFALNLMNFY